MLIVRCLLEEVNGFSYSVYAQNYVVGWHKPIPAMESLSKGVARRLREFSMVCKVELFPSPAESIHLN